ncbi:MAG: cellulase family glycosylhydrolase [Myxococcales bacterium]|nr:cellulase family glycosylhydrolase [Myxococcales bacterium]
MVGRRAPVAACLFAVAAAAGGCGGGGGEAPPAPSGWRVSDGWLRQDDGRVVLLRGVNLAGAHKQAPYFGFHQAVDFERVRSAWGMNTLRFLTTWAAVEPDEGVYDEAYLDALELRLDWAGDAGLHVVLDMHQDVYGEGFGFDGAPRWTCDEAHYAAFQPITPWFLNYQSPEVLACVDGFWHGEALQTHFLGAWRALAARFATHPAVVGFEPMNEPHWGSAPMGSFESTVLAPFYEKIVAGVRELAPGWVAFLEPSASRNLGVPTSLPGFSFGNWVYAPHAYDASAEQGNGFDPAHREAFLVRYAALVEEAALRGAALWIGEYGGTSSSPGITEYMDAAYDGTASARAGSTYWAYDRNSGGYGLLEDSGAEKDVLLDVVARPFPERVAGTPRTIAFDETTSTFTFAWEPDPALAAPTELSIPDRAYPQGYTVTCAGCAYEKRPNQLVVTTPPSDGVVGVAP